MAWPGAPELGATIAKVLREKVVEDKSGFNSKHFKLTRDQEIIGLAAIHREQGLPANESRRRIAEMFRMEVEAVRKVLERATLDK